MNVYNNRPIQSIDQVLDKSKTTAKQQVQNSKSDFATILSNKLGEAKDVKMSKHAEIRMQSRNISLDENQVERLKTAVDKASTKGVRDTLVVMDNIAFVVNVNARTVITAVNQSELKDNVFTQIDGAVFT